MKIWVSDMEIRSVCKTCVKLLNRKKRMATFGAIRWYHTKKTWHIAPRKSHKALCGRWFFYDRRGFSGE